MEGGGRKRIEALLWHAIEHQYIEDRYSGQRVPRRIEKRDGFDMLIAWRIDGE